MWNRQNLCDDVHIMKWLTVGLAVVTAAAFAISVQAGVWW
jgi:hypothetical protein